MNKLRRKALAAIMERLEEVKADLEMVAEEEEEAFDNIPESLEGTERYEAAEAAVENLQEAISSFEDLLSYIEEATA